MAAHEISYHGLAIAGFALLLVMHLAVMAIFVRIGVFLSSRYSAEQRAVLDTFQTALLTLVALLLAFGVSMSEARFESRLQVLGQEVNAISTLSRRVDLLEPGDRGAIKAALKRYAALRVDGYRIYGLSTEGKAAHESTVKLQEELWRRCVAAVRKVQTSTLVPLVIQSLNEALDLEEKQGVVFRNHLPISVFVLLFLGCILVAAACAFKAGLSQTPQRAFMVILAMLLSFTLFVILDLDRPRGGFIRIYPASLIRLSQSL